MALKASFLRAFLQMDSRMLKARNFSKIKIKIKDWKPENCFCRNYKVYISNVGFT